MMNGNSSEKKPQQRRRSKGRWVVLLGGGTVVAGLLQGCPPAEFPIPEVCAEQGRAQGALIELARQAMTVYGRIDPLLYVPNEQGQLDVDKDARRRIESDALADALAKVNADPLLARALVENRESALRVCGGSDCPKTEYTIDVKAGPTNDKNIVAYEWTVTGEPLLDERATKMVDALYSLSVPNPQECNAPDAMQVKGARGGVMFAALQGNCIDYDEDKEGDKCKPPKKGHWKKTEAFGETYLCCG